MSEGEHQLFWIIVAKRHIWFQVTSHNIVTSRLFYAAGVQSYHFLLSSSSRHPDHDVFPHFSLGGLPADIQGAGGGVGDLQVPHEAQRPCAQGTTHEVRINTWFCVVRVCVCVCLCGGAVSLDVRRQENKGVTSFSLIHTLWLLRSTLKCFLILGPSISFYLEDKLNQLIYIHIHNNNKNFWHRKN